MTAHDLLTRAAAKVRETAEGATPGPWTTYRNNSMAGVEVLGPGRRQVVAAKQFFAPPDTPLPPDVNHLSFWSPDRALLVADWLDAEAESQHPHAWDAARLDAALALARSILKED